MVGVRTRPRVSAPVSENVGELPKVEWVRLLRQASREAPSHSWSLPSLVALRPTTRAFRREPAEAGTSAAAEQEAQSPEAAARRAAEVMLESAPPPEQQGLQAARAARRRAAEAEAQRADARRASTALAVSMRATSVCARAIPTSANPPSATPDAAPAARGRQPLATRSYGPPTGTVAISPLDFFTTSSSPACVRTRSAG